MVMPTNIVKKEKLHFIDYFRAISIILIVAGHCIYWGKPHGIIRETNLYLFTGGTFLFVFISGFLFQYLSYKFEYKSYLIKKWKNVILPYIITCVPVAIYASFTLQDVNNPLYNNSFFERVIAFSCFGTILNVPTWFIAMIIIFFLLSPLFLKIQKNKWLWYFLLISSILYTCLSPRPNVWKSYSNINGNFLAIIIYHIKFTLTNFFVFLSSYLYGIFCCNLMKKDKKWLNTILKWGFIVSLALWFGIYLYKIILHHKLNANIAKFLSISIYFSGLYLLEKYILNKPAMDKALKLLANYSFGIFFIHFYFIDWLHWHCIYRIYGQPTILDFAHNSSRAFFNSIFLFSVSLFGSILAIYLIKELLLKLGIKNTRMFIGVGDTKKRLVAIEGKYDK
ncbi:TPA: hypothetical protein CPT81_07730 [Candidatus Gastranaerophilales bacterium HUM_20]|nr:MAG TPA: hypothetical protein CPT81_07730 [Candidatus Gastranaerophilales bacterium HUM_20]